MPNDNDYIAPSLVHSHDVQLDADYIQWLVELKSRYRSAQIKAAVRVNAEKLPLLQSGATISATSHCRNSNHTVLYRDCE